MRAALAVIASAGAAGALGCARLSPSMTPAEVYRVVQDEIPLGTKIPEVAERAQGLDLRVKGLSRGPEMMNGRPGEVCSLRGEMDPEWIPLSLSVRWGYVEFFFDDQDALVRCKAETGVGGP